MYSPSSEEHSVELLFEDPLVVVTAPNKLARRRKIEFAELLDEPWTLQPRENNLGRSHGCPSRCWPCCSIADEVIE
jgi:hypothetical protein